MPNSEEKCGGCGSGTPKMPTKNFADVRRDCCNSCDNSKDGICIPVESLHPGKANIEHGVIRPELRCPLPEPKWTEEPSTCPRCGAAVVMITRKHPVCMMCRNDDQVAMLNLKPLDRRQQKAALKKRVYKAVKPARIEWAVAVTTAPRTDCTLLRCVNSLRIAGWDKTVVFAEPGSTASDCETVQNETRKGCWHNWLAACRWTLDNTNASVIMTVQDDSLFHPDSRSFAESVLWPSKDAGYLSLYTPSHYRGAGIFRSYPAAMWGACALVFPRSSLERIIESDVAKTWLGARVASGSETVMQRRREHPETIANSDTAIGKIINKLGLSMWYTSPSPVSHIARHSTLKHGSNRGKRNCHPCADHSRPLRDQVFA